MFQKSQINNYSKERKCFRKELSSYGRFSWGAGGGGGDAGAIWFLDKPAPLDQI